MRPRKLALVLRPQPGNRETCARIDDLANWRAIGLPLTQRVPTGIDRPEGHFDALVLTSAEAARVLASSPDLTDIAALPVHCLGAATATSARLAGFTDVMVGAGDGPSDSGEELARQLAARFPYHRLLYPCARERRPGLEDAARETSMDVLAWPVYRTVALPRAGNALAERLAGDDFAAILVHAPSAARLWSETVVAHGLQARVRRSALLLMSSAVAEAVPAGLGGRRHVASRPTDGNLLDLLKFCGSEAK